jgi:signal transduction histidine kinase
MDLERDKQIFGCIVRDISNRKKAEQALLRSEQRLRALSGALLSAQDDERRHLAMELHDDLGQSMTVLKLQIRSLKDYLNTSLTFEKDEIVNHLEDLRLFVNGLIENIRQLSRELWPMIVDDLGIDAALTHLQSSFQGASQLHVEISNCGIGPLLSVARQRHLYRIIQESLNNVIKHAKAHTVSIRISQGNGQLVVDIEDDGIGFEVDSLIRSTGAKRGIGLQSINERVEMLDGLMEIRSSPGCGTGLHFTLSLPTNPSL